MFAKILCQLARMKSYKIPFADTIAMVITITTQILFEGQIINKSH